MSHWHVSHQFRLILVAAIVAGGATATWAQKGRKKKEEAPAPVAREVAWRHDLRAALAEAEAAGKPVFADFFATWCGPCKRMLETTFVEPRVIAFLNQNYIPVKIDVDLDSESSQRFGIRSMPTMIFLKPDGTEAHKVIGGMEADTFLSEAQKGLDAVGPLAPPAKTDLVKKTLASAKKALASGRMGSAYTLLKKVATSEPQGLPEIAEAKEELEKLEKEAQGKMDEVRGLVEAKDFAKVAGSLEELEETYAGMPVAEEATTLRDQLRSDPEASLAIRSAEAETVYEETVADIKSKKYGIALVRLEGLAGKYADLPVGKKIQKELDDLRGDPKIVQAVRDDQARTQSNAWLSLARTWAKNSGNKRASAKAKEYYERVIKSFPETTFATTAKEELASL